ncbi:MAG: hypothetical protein ACO1G9_04800 [Bacteroidota bacterium]
MKIKLLIVVAFLVQSFSVKAVDPSASFYIDNPLYISPGIYEFDVVVKASGATSSFDLRTFQAGIYVNPAWVNGGVLTLSTAPGYSELTSPSYNGAYQWNATDKLINCSVNYNVKPSPTTCISTLVDVNPLRVARIRATNSVSFGCATPDMKFNYVANNSPLRLRTSFSWRESGCTTNYELFYPGRAYNGVAKFNDETYSTSDADSRSTVRPAVNVGNCFPLLELTMMLEGYYAGGSTMQSVLLNQAVKSVSYLQTDSVTIELRPESNPGTVFASIRGVVMTDGKITCALPAGAAYNTYYVAVYHRNTVQSWSNPILIDPAFTSYDFTSNLSQTYADNASLVDAGVYAFFTGDLNQDEFVDAGDFPLFDFDNSEGLFGDYFATDLNGDGFVDAGDFPFYDQNNSLGVFSLHP